MTPRVLNLRECRTTPNGATYVGRGTKWGNPFRIGRDGTREEVIAKYRERLLNFPALLADLHELHDRDLCCWCAPLPCHAEVLVELANA